jgi:hypothetical protein
VCLAPRNRKRLAGSLLSVVALAQNLLEVHIQPCSSVGTLRFTFAHVLNVTQNVLAIGGFVSCCGSCSAALLGFFDLTTDYASWILRLQMVSAISCSDSPCTWLSRCICCRKQLLRFLVKLLDNLSRILSATGSVNLSVPIAVQSVLYSLGSF